MPEDHYVVTEQHNVFQRLGDSILGAVIGVVLIIAACCLLLWNEHAAVSSAKSLAEAQRLVVAARADALDPANDGRPVYLFGTIAAPGGALADPDTGVRAPALKLVRKVETYAWQESSTSTTQKHLGGGDTVTTDYKYETVWTEDPADSSRFAQPAGHTNPPRGALETRSFVATGAALGPAADGTTAPYPLASSLLERLSADQPYSVTGATGAGFKAAAGGLYQGADPTRPAVGDERVSYTVAPPGPYSLIAAQTNGALAPYRAKAGDTVAIIVAGNVAMDELFADIHRGNTLFTWLLRLVGFFLMFVGLALLTGPLGTLADIVPFVGNIVGFGLFLGAFLLAIPLTLFVIGIGWFAARPLLALALLAIAVAVFAFLAWHGKRRKAAAVA
jgi:hypothetical protein